MLYLRYMLVALLVFTAALTFFLPGQLRAPPDEDTVNIGIFPRRDVLLTEQLFKPMAKYLANQLGRRVRLISTNTFYDFWQGVVEQKYDLVHYNQYHYLISNAEYDYEVIAINEEQGRSTITGMLIVRKDSGIDSIADLKGKKILFGGGPKAMQSYIYPRYLLELGGISTGDYVTSFAPNPPSAIVAIFHGLEDAAAAGAGDAALMIAGKNIDTKELKVLAQGKQYASLPWAVKGSLDAKLKSQLQNILINLSNTDQGRSILQRAELTGIIPAQDADFDPHRKIVQAVLGEEF